MAKQATKQATKQIRHKELKKKEKEVFFVGIKEPLEIRRNLLEASREMILLLQMYEKFKMTRDDKRRELERLRIQIREITSLANKLRKHLPKTNLRAMPEEEIPKREPKMVKVVEPKPEIKREERVLKRELTEIEKLEAELASIEEKLNHLA